MLERVLCPTVVGRDAERAALEAALASVVGGTGRAVLLAGEAGVGKTRLSSELRRVADRSGLATLWGGCSEVELTVPYLPFLQAIGNHLDQADDAFSARIRSSAPALTRFFPRLAGGDLPPQPADPSQAKLQLFESVVAFLKAAADTRGVLLVVDDLHWADSSTRELLDYVLRRIDELRTMILATYRADEMHRRHPLLPMVNGWKRSGVASVLELQPLGAHQISQMVEAILDVDSVSSGFRDMLHERSEGNPFVLEELLKDAIDRGDVYRGASGWERKELSQLRIPRSVADTILLRLERIGDDKADILKAASVFGRTFDYDLLARVAAVPEALVAETVDAAIREQLVETDPATESRLRFRHSLTWEAVYGDMVSPRRRQLHSRVADVLLEAGNSDSELARHLLAAGRTEEAAPVCVSAAEKAFAQSGYRVAADLYEQAAAITANLAERARLICRMGEALWFASESRLAMQALEQGLSEAAVDPVEAAHYRIVLGRCYWEDGRLEDSHAQYRQAMEVLEPLGPSHDLALTYMRLASQHIFQLEDEPARELAQLAIQTAEACGDDVVRIWSYNFLGLATAGLGVAGDGIELVERSYREADAAGMQVVAVNALFNLADTCDRALKLREFPRLLRELERHKGTQWQDFSYHFWSSHWHFQQCRIDQALIAARQASEIAKRSSGVTYQLRAARITGDALLYSGQLSALLSMPEPFELMPDLQELPRQIPLAVATGLEAGRPDLFEEPLERWLSSRERLAAFTFSADWVVAALLALGRRDDARSVAVACGSASMLPDDPYLSRMQGRLALSAGELESAAAAFGDSHRVFESAGYVLEGLFSRELLAAAALELENREEAVAELTFIHTTAAHGGAHLLTRRVESRLAELGVSVETEQEASGGAASPGVVSERLVTVLFTDVRNYTKLSGEEAPRELVERLATLHRTAAHIVKLHHGVIDKFAGDAIMATFNVAQPRLDHTVQALETALELRERAQAVGLAVGSGLAVGAAVVGQLAEGANVSVIGATTNLAARLQAQAGPGEVVISADAQARVRERLTELGLAVTEESLQLKGFDDPVRAFRIAAPAGSAEN